MLDRRSKRFDFTGGEPGFEALLPDMDLFGNAPRLEATEQFALRVGAVGLTGSRIEPDAIGRWLKVLTRRDRGEVRTASLLREGRLAVADGHHIPTLLASDAQRLVTNLFVVHVIASRAGLAGKLHPNSNLRLGMSQCNRCRGPMREHEKRSMAPAATQGACKG